MSQQLSALDIVYNNIIDFLVPLKTLINGTNIVESNRLNISTLLISINSDYKLKLTI